MHRLVAKLTGLAGLLLTQGLGIPAWAQGDAFSGAEISRGCRAALDFAYRGDFGGGVCMGAIYALMNLDKRTMGYCVPKGVTIDQATRVVVAYIDELPARKSEPFDVLAIAALQRQWPCLR